MRGISPSISAMACWSTSGYPQAHEDDAQRAVRAGLGMVEAMGQLNTRLAQERGVQLAVRLGIHTGLVVVGEIGGGARQEQLALGETPNLAARLQGLAAPNTLVISAATFQLLGGFFACQSLGTPLLKGVAQPLEVYQVLYESMARSRLEAAGQHRPDPAGGPGAGSGAAAGALGAGQGRPGAGGAAQRRSGHRQIAPGAGADGTGGHRAPGLADAVPVFALSPEHRLVSADRSAGAGGAALRAGGVPRAEAVANWRGSWCSMACRWRRPCPSLPPSSPSRWAPTMPPDRVSPSSRSSRPCTPS